MKTKELREMTREELELKIRDLKEDLFNLRFQHATNQLDNSLRLRFVRRELARVKTVLREQELQA